WFRSVGGRTRGSPLQPKPTYDRSDQLVVSWEEAVPGQFRDQYPLHPIGRQRLRLSREPLTEVRLHAHAHVRIVMLDDVQVLDGLNLDREFPPPFPHSALRRG